MLVLSRKLKQEILIGENIKITVLKVKGNSVRLGIEAPREVHVVRGEIPKKSDVVGLEEATKEPEGEFTVVFTNTDEEQGSKVDLIPFDNNFDCPESSQEVGTKLQSNSSVESISFRNKLPQALQHNRLKEIVSQLTAK